MRKKKRMCPYSFVTAKPQKDKECSGRKCGLWEIDKNGCLLERLNEDE